MASVLTQAVVQPGRSSRRWSGESAARPGPAAPAEAPLYVPPAARQYARVRLPPGSWAYQICDCWSMCPAVPLFSSVLFCYGYARTLSRAGLFPYRDVLLITFAYFVIQFSATQILSPYSALRREAEAEGSEFGEEREGEGAHSRHPYELFDSEGVAAPGWVFPLKFIVDVLGVIFWGLTVYARIKLVDKYRISEHRCLSCMCVTFCPPCALAQEMMHVDVVEHGSVQQDCRLTAQHPLAAEHAHELQ